MLNEIPSRTVEIPSAKFQSACGGPTKLKNQKIKKHLYPFPRIVRHIHRIPDANYI